MTQQKTQTILQAYEVYSLVGGGYNKRHLHGYAWTKTDAQTIADTVHPRRYYIGVVHLIKIGDLWHRVHVVPIDSIAGDVAQAENSRILAADTPKRFIPGINFQIGETPPRRLGLDLETAINTLAEYPKDSECKLYTLRTGGRLPITFRIRDLSLSEHTQKLVVTWLRHEIDFRISQGERNEPQ